MPWNGWGGGWLMMISWWVLIILGIVVLVKWMSQQGSKPAKGDSAPPLHSVMKSINPSS